MNPTGIEAAHDPKLVDALRTIKARLEALPEPLRGPFLVKGLAPYAPATSPTPAAEGIVERLEVARDFPKNTCPASRHVQMIGEALIARQPYAMIEEDPEYVGQSILSVVASLYETRTELSEAADTITALSAERDRLQAKIDHAQYAMDTVAKFVRPRIPADQNPEQATSFLAWIGMILRLEQRAEQAGARAATAREKALEEAAAVADDHASAWGLAMGQQAKEIAAAIRSLTQATPPKEKT